MSSNDRARASGSGGPVASDVTLRQLAGFVVIDRAIAGTDRHAAGKAAAQEALERIAPDVMLGYEGTRAIVVRGNDTHGPIAISITHTLSRAFAVAARVERIGIDLVEDIDEARFEKMAPRYLHGELAFARTPRDIASCFAAKEAGLKALGLGLLDGGMFDQCAVNVLSLEPPRLASTSHPLSLVFGRIMGGTLAIAYG